MNTQTPESRGNEEVVKEFGNSLGLQLKPSNDTMEAVRLAKKELLPILETKDTLHKQELATLKENFETALSYNVTDEEKGRVLLALKALTNKEDTN